MFPIIVSALVLLFIFGNIYAEISNLKGLSLRNTDLSDYLVLPRGGVVQSLSYVGLAAGLFLLPFVAIKTPVFTDQATVWKALTCTAGVALLCVVATEWVRAQFVGFDNGTWRAAHLVSAGIAFTSAIAAEAIFTLHTSLFWLTLVAPASVLVWLAYNYRATSMAEKTCALLMSLTLLVMMF